MFNGIWALLKFVSNLKLWTDTKAAMKVAAYGVILLIVAYVYDVLFAGIPYQDPTPEMQSKWEMHKSIAGWIYTIGTLVLLSGVFSIVVQRIKHNKQF